MGLSKYVVLIGCLFIALLNHAQEAGYSVVQGHPFTVSVSQSAGNTYQWKLFQDENLTISANTADYMFSLPLEHSTVLAITKAGVYYSLITESTNLGCSTSRFVKITVLQNNFKVFFTTATSSVCYQASSNFILPIQFKDESNGLPVAATHFPISVTFQVNGVTQPSQAVAFADQNLVISGSSYVTNPNQDTQVVVKITGATDSQNLTIKPETTSGQDIHTHTIFTRPQILFAEPETAGLLKGDQRSFSVTGSSGNTYQYTIFLPDGSTQTLTSTTTQSGNITFSQTGSYTLQVQATDTRGCLSEWATKTINVENNVPLQAVADVIIIPMETPVTIDVLANDLGLLATTKEIVPAKSVQGGTLTKNANGSVIYTPAPGFWGDDSFTYQLCPAGQTTGCSQATVSIKVKNSALNNAGVLAITDMNNTWAGMTVSGNVLSNDLFFDPALVEAKVVTIPPAETGKLTFFDKKTGDYTFVPAAGFSGEAFFEYQICQKDETGKVVCSTSNVSIKVLSSVPDDPAPVANNDVALTLYNTAIKGNFLQNDFIPGSGSFSILQVRSSGLSGSLKWEANGDFLYVPQNGFTGENHFTYQICNGNGKCDWGIVSIYVMPSGLLQNDLYANYSAYFTTGQLTGNLSDNDFNSSGAALVYQTNPVTSAAHGSVQVQPDGSFTYIPPKGLFGQMTDQFVVETCTATTPHLCSKETVYIVGNIPKIVLLASSEITTGSCLPVTLDASASTGAGKLTYKWEPEVFLNDPASSSPVFTPGLSTDYTLTVTDKSGNTATKTIHVKVDPAPQIATANQLFVQSASEVIMLDASSSIGNGLKYNWSSTLGGVIVSGGETAKPQVKGIGKYYLQVTDRYGCTDLDSVIVGLYVQVKAVNDTSEVLVNNTVDINVLANDMPKGELNPATLRIVTAPQNGIATVVGDSLVSYLPNQYYTGSDNFIYSICDYFEHCDQATVLVIVSDVPFFIPEAFSPNGDGINDKFEIKGISKYKTVQIEIFNRWGNVVYRSDNYGEGQGKSGFWDGKAGQGVRFGSGPVPTGTYFYVLKLDGKEKLNGAIYLDR